MTKFNISLLINVDSHCRFRDKKLLRYYAEIAKKIESGTAMCVRERLFNDL